MKDHLNFDLSALLKLKELDIRKIVRENPSLLVGEYFSLLTKFVSLEKMINDTLMRISVHKANNNDFTFIADTKTLLLDIGSYSLIPVIDDVVSFGKRSNTISTADYVQKLQEDYNKLYTKIKAAIKSGNEDDAPNKEDGIQFSRETQILKKVIQLLDHNESTRKLRVLAVDDTPSILKMISSVLADDYKVDVLINPAMVEKFLQQITPELFLLDYQMPELNGFDLVPIIRNFEEHKDTPIIFLTSMGTIDHVSAAYTLGACDYIVKPFEDTVLREKVAKHIVRKKLL